MTPACLAAIVAFACYAGILSNPFVFDDVEIIAKNPLVTGSRIDLPAIFTSHYWAHLRDDGDLYRPLTILSYALNHALGGLEPAPYHAVNMILHALASGLVVLLAASFGLSSGAAAAAGLLFAVHPVHTEAVTGTVGRADLLAAAAVLAAWLLHVRRAPTGRGAGRGLAIAVLFAAGLLSKESAIVLPALMLLGEFPGRAARGGLRGALRSRGLTYPGCAAVAIAWLALRAALLPAAAGSPLAEGPLDAAPPTARIATALSIAPKYLQLAAAPVALSADYSYDQIPIRTSPLEPLPLLGAGLILAMGALALLLLKSSRPAASAAGRGLAAFLLAMAPVCNLFIPIGTLLGERLLYLPTAGLCIAGAALGSLAAGRFALPRVATAGVVTLLAALGAWRTWERNLDWKDQLTLFTATVRTSPRSAKAWYNYGRALEDAGRSAEALDAYRAAIEIRPDDQRSRYNAALLLASGGREAEAIEQMSEAARLDPTLPAVHATLGALLAQSGRLSEAEEALTAARGAGVVREDLRLALFNLGTLQLSRGRIEPAILSLEEAAALAPADAETRHQLGLALLAAGRAARAAGELSEALRLDPGDPSPLIPLARALASSGRIDEAAAAARRARAAGLDVPPDLQVPQP